MDRTPARPSEEVKAENNGELLMDRSEVKENKKEVLMDQLPIRPPVEAIENKRELLMDRPPPRPPPGLNRK